MIIAAWYGIVAFSLSTYVVLDGRNFGAGILQRFVAREPLERRQVIAAIGPLWTWHEVWLVSTGGAIFLAFPRLLASAFSGYYLALFLILWCVVLRGVSIEVGAHIDDHLWQTFWDAVFTLSSTLLALLFGAALGNVIRGVPLHPDGTFSMAFFTNFRATGDVGLLDAYTVSVAFFCALVLAAHGATYITARTEGPVHARAVTMARRLWLAAIPGFLAISLFTERVRPELFRGLASRPLAWLGATICVGSVVALYTGLRSGREKRAFLGSSFLLQGILLSGAATLFPVILFSTLDANDRLTAQNCAASHESLVTGCLWWPIALVLAFVYAFVVRRYYYSDRVGASRDTASPY
jgi:cytochrome d ubiquinol oxidase subunit II